MRIDLPVVVWVAEDDDRAPSRVKRCSVVGATWVKGGQICGLLLADYTNPDYDESEHYYHPEAPCHNFCANDRWWRTRKESLANVPPRKRRRKRKVQTLNASAFLKMLSEQYAPKVEAALMEKVSPFAFGRHGDKT